MANRRLNQFMFSNIPMPTKIFCQITFGSSGAPTLAANGNFVTGVTRNSAGDYTLTLGDAYNALVGIRHTFNSGSSAPASPAMWVRTNAVTTKSLRIVFNAAGTPTDPASGEIVYLEISLRNSSVAF